MNPGGYSCISTLKLLQCRYQSKLKNHININNYFQKIGNLKNFVTDIKSKLKNEFSALMALAEAEEELLGSQPNQAVQYLTNHPSMIAYNGRRKRSTYEFP